MLRRVALGTLSVSAATSSSAIAVAATSASNSAGSPTILSAARLHSRCAPLSPFSTSSSVAADRGDEQGYRGGAGGGGYGGGGRGAGAYSSQSRRQGGGGGVGGQFAPRREGGGAGPRREGGSGAGYDRIRRGGSANPGDRAEMRGAPRCGRSGGGRDGGDSMKFSRDSGSGPRSPRGGNDLRDSGTGPRSPRGGNDPRDSGMGPRSPRGNNDRRNHQRGPVIPRARDWSKPKAEPAADDIDAAQVQESDDVRSTQAPSEDDELGPSSLLDAGPQRGARTERGGRGERPTRKKGSRGSLLSDDHEDFDGPSSGSKAKGKGGNSGSSEADKKKPSKPAKPLAPKVVPVQREVFLPSVVTVSNLARQIGVKMRTLQNSMTDSGMTDTRPDLILTFSDAEMLAAEFNLTAVVNEEAAFDILPRDPASSDEYARLPLRPPVVTIMGHVDHGKTTLLDKLRSTSVAAGEAGGITQHIGAFSVPVKRNDADPSAGDSSIKTVTFLDTPGHAAFTAMRSRGAAVTDIVVLVVAADDGVMPQTREVIGMIQTLSAESARRSASPGDTGGNLSSRRQAGSVQVVVALTKVDKPESDAERVKRELLSAGVELEEHGGDIPCVEVSGKTGKGLDLLEETLAVLAEMADLRAEREGRAEGYIIESKVEKARGNVATVLVKRGVVKVGDLLLAGTSWCKVRQILDSNSQAMKVAYPGDPVLVMGWRDLPNAGEEVLGAPDEASIKKAIENRKARKEREDMIKDVEMINEQRRARSLEQEAQARREFEERQRRREARLAADKGAESVLAEEGDTEGQRPAGQAHEDEAADDTDVAAQKSDYKALNLIIKADFSGTVEAVEGAIASIGNSEAGVKVISTGVGPPTDGDVAKASALGGHIVCFNVDIPKAISQLAARSHPPVMLHSDTVIYRLMDYVTSAVVALLPPLFEQRVTGEAQVSKLFSISISSKVSRTIAGCRVTNGNITRSNLVRILRTEGDERKEIWKGRLDQLKHGKKDVQEMRKGTECGLSFVGFEGFKEGDVVQSYYEVEVPRKL